MKETDRIVKDIKDLYSKNRSITKLGGFFTPEQVQNEQKAWKLIKELERKLGVEKLEINFFEP